MERFIDKQYLTDHPEGMIRLLDGNLLDGYKKDEENSLMEVFHDDEIADYLFYESRGGSLIGYSNLFKRRCFIESSRDLCAQY